MPLSPQIGVIPGGTTQDAVLLAIVARLIANVTTPEPLTEATCFVSLLTPTFMQPGPLWVQVAPGAGQFDQDSVSSGGQNNTPEDGSIVVGIFSRAFLDEAGQDVQTLTNATIGLMQLKKGILAALVDFNPAPLTTQSVMVSGGPTAGSYTITYTPPSGPPETTAAIAWNANAAAVQAALRLLAGLSVAVVSQSGVLPGIVTNFITFNDPAGVPGELAVTDSTTGGSHAVTAALVPILRSNMLPLDCPTPSHTGWAENDCAVWAVSFSTSFQWNLS
jgi:hypothetical protein